MQKNFPEDNWRNNRPMLTEITDNLNQEGLSLKQKENNQISL